MPSKPPSWNEIRNNLTAFAAEWGSETREAAEYASFWDELLRCYGVERRRVAIFQQQAQRASTSNTGFIDFFWPKVAIGEHKSLGKAGPEGRDAEEQAFDYLAGGSIEPADFPRYVISTDFATIRVTDLEADGGSASSFFLIADLRDHAEELGFLGGYQSAAIETSVQEQASVAAAKVMAKLYAALTSDADVEYDADDATVAEDDDEESHRIAILLTRLLFLMFGDDASLWDRGMFLRFLEERTTADGSDLGSQLTDLFRVLDTPERQRPARLDESLRRFPYVNGGVFDRTDDVGLLAFDRAMRDALIEACRFDWSKISPAVFGSLFQAVKSRQARRAAGEHYTTETNILKTLGPLFLDDYRARVRAAWDSSIRLRRLQAELATNTYVDPACGCGNFLVVAYRELRAIELTIIERLRELAGDLSLSLDVTIGLSVSLDQFTGIEIGWWPAKIAETAMFLVDHQANRAMAAALGAAPERLPIAISANIVHDTALGEPWDERLPKVDGRTFVFGNPPFLGHKTKKAQQRQELAAAWGSSASGTLDYVTAWHAKALELYRADGRSGDWAFVTTNSISQGEQVDNLFGAIFDAGWRIKYAHRTFGWESEAPGAAAVHCVIVGFTRDGKTKPRLFEYPSLKSDPVETPTTGLINGYLIDGPDVRVKSRTKPLSAEVGEVAYGTMPADGGHLLVSAAEHPAFAADDIAAKYLRRFVGAKELVYDADRWCLWLADASADDIRASPLLRERVQANQAWRSDQVRTGDAYKLRETPHLLRGNRTRPLKAYVCIPRHVTESRRFYTVARFAPEVIAGDANFTMDDPDGLQFGLVSSAMFMAWQRAVGGRIKSDLRFAKGLTWYTFPVPTLSEAQRAAIIAGGIAVLDARALHPQRSLAQHYDPLSMSRELLSAHATLDRAVDKAFGSSRRIEDDSARERILFQRYTEILSEGQPAS